MNESTMALLAELNRQLLQQGDAAALAQLAQARQQMAQLEALAQARQDLVKAELMNVAASVGLPMSF